MASASSLPATWIVVAETGGRFASFSPYAAVVDGRGVVSFQARLVGGGSGVFASDGRDIRQVAGAPEVEVTSHPDRNAAGDCSFYGRHADGREGIWLAVDGRVAAIADTSGDLLAVGPAGPTVGEGGTVAFRARRRSLQEGVYLGRSGRSGGTTAIAETGSTWSAFHGLPVAVDDGVVFRADRGDGTHGIYVHRAGAVDAVVETGETFLTLGLFPSAARDGTVAFAGTLRGGGCGVFTLDRRGALREEMRDGAYESYRGALIASPGAVVAIATPHGGTLGLFAGRDPVLDRVVALGDPVLDSRVVDLAANPVSINASRQLAVRLTLADARQLVVRVDPA